MLKYFLSAKSNRNKDETIPELWQSREKTCLRSSLFYLSNIHYSSKPQNINEFACLVSTYLIYPRYDENVDSAEDRYLFRDESVPLMELTVQIISKVFLLDGRQVLFHVSVNIPKPSRKPSGKKKEYMFESNRKTRWRKKLPTKGKERRMRSNSRSNKSGEEKNWPFLSYIIVARVRNYDTHEAYYAYERENCP